MQQKNAQLQSQLNSGQGSRRDDELSDLCREVELKHLKNEKLDQELEPKCLKKEQKTPK
jgi:hypothetical protein